MLLRRCCLPLCIVESVLKFVPLQGRKVYVSAVPKKEWPKSVEAAASPPKYLASSPEEETEQAANPSPPPSPRATRAQTAKGAGGQPEKKKRKLKTVGGRPVSGESEKMAPSAHGVHIGRGTAGPEAAGRGKGVADDDDHLTLAERQELQAKQKKRDARAA